MLRRFAKPVPLLALLAFWSLIPILATMVRMVQIPLGRVPQDSIHLAVVPVSLFLHAAGGTLFGILGPIQFARVLRHRFGRLHRISGRIFAVAGAALGLSGLSILAQVEPQSTLLVDLFRLGASLALLASLAIAILAARRHEIERHRNWIIRAYVIGMGSGSIALVMFPIFLITGAPLNGILSDIVFTGSWAATILVGEGVIRSLPSREPRVPGPGPAARLIGGMR